MFVNNNFCKLLQIAYVFVILCVISGMTLDSVVNFYQNLIYFITNKNYLIRLYYIYCVFAGEIRRSLHLYYPNVVNSELFQGLRPGSVTYGIDLVTLCLFVYKKKVSAPKSNSCGVANLYWYCLSAIKIKMCNYHQVLCSYMFKP